ncbi:MAG: serine--tRNA ligase [Candidatus Diapherotrites archaeon]|nr:serine--tRNA ligase [Candidatus Diapherotrites archaeon]
MLDIKEVRENTALIRKNLEKRRDSAALTNFDLLVKTDVEYRKLLQDSQKLREERNKLTEEIKQLKAKKKNADSLLASAKKISDKLKETDIKKEKIFQEFIKLIYLIPNVLDDSVPYGKSDEDNVEVRKWGNTAKNELLIHHGVLAAELGLADFERAAKISGSGFFFLQGELALLEQALIQFSLKKLISKGFVFVSPPLMINRKAYEGVTDLNDFENVMYKIEGQDLYLIATSEHPLTAMYSDEAIDSRKLPLKHCGLSPCFRKEVGKRAIDERGLFRVHQFNKVEQIVFCMPEASAKMLELLVLNAEELLKELEIPYRVVNICTGDIGIVAAKKYDLEGWSPREGKYIELMSCSNCLSYQAVRSNIKFVLPDGSRGYLHTLNATMAAIPRILRIILEQNQTDKKTIKVPKALIPFMDGLKEIKKRTD